MNIELIEQLINNYFENYRDEMIKDKNKRFGFIIKLNDISNLVTIKELYKLCYKYNISCDYNSFANDEVRFTYYGMK